MDIIARLPPLILGRRSATRAGANIGPWTSQVEAEGAACVDTYRYRPEGTADVTSGRESSISYYEISDQPLRSGMYRMADVIAHGNHKPDGRGHHVPVSDRVEPFIRFDATCASFTLCLDDHRRSCQGTLSRVGTASFAS
jgi:hypothetical protein